MLAGRSRWPPCARRRAAGHASSPKGPRPQTIDNLLDPGVHHRRRRVRARHGRRPVRRRQVPQRKDDDDRPARRSSTATSSSRSAGRSSRPSSSPASASPPSLTLLDLDEQPPDGRHARSTVIGQQWWWEYQLRRRRRRRVDDIVTANDLVIPAGQPIASRSQSRDVIHSFWIPALNGKTDAVPGPQPPAGASRPTSPACTVGQCTEFCGLSHAYMRMQVVALSRGRLRGVEPNQQQGAGHAADERRWPRRAWSCSAPAVLAAATSIDRRRATTRSTERAETGIDGVSPVSGSAPRTSPTSLSRGAFAGAIFDLLGRPVDGNGEIDADEIGGRARSTRPTSRRGCATHRPRSRWPRRGQRPRHAQPRPHRGADRPARRLPETLE